MNQVQEYQKILQYVSMITGLEHESHRGPFDKRYYHQSIEFTLDELETAVRQLHEIREAS